MIELYQYTGNINNPDDLYEQIATISEGKFIDGEDQARFVDRSILDDEEKLLEQYTGPGVVAVMHDDPEEKSAPEVHNFSTASVRDKEWVPYEGPRGGEGWEHTDTGERRYQEEKPVGEGETENDSDDAAYDRAHSLLREHIAEIEEAGPDETPAGYVSRFSSEIKWTVDWIARFEDSETAANALIDALDDISDKLHPKYEEDALWAAEEILSKITKMQLKDIKTTVTLENGEEILMGSRAVENEDFAPRSTVDKILRSKGFEYDSIVHTEAWDVIKRQRLGPGAGVKPGRMRELNHIAVEDFGVQNKRPTIVTHEEREAVEQLRAIRGPMIEGLRNVYGDTITVYRGERMQFWSDDRLSEGEDGQTYLEYDRHRQVESWSVRPRVAEEFGEVILKQEVPVEEVVHAHFTGAGFDHELEIMLPMDKTMKWEVGKNIFRKERYTLPDDDKSVITERELLQEEMRTYQIHSKLALQSSLEVDKEWQEYEGPQGGEGWINTITGDRRYQDEKPEPTNDLEGGGQLEEEPRPKWFEEDVARYGQLEEPPNEGEYLIIGDDIVKIGEAQGDSIRTVPTYDWEDPKEYKVIDGVVSLKSSGRRSKDAVVLDNETVYLEFPEDSELEDGWYKSGNGYNESISIQSESGEEVKISRAAPEAKYSPTRSETLNHSMGTPWEKYQGQEYPTDARIMDTISPKKVGDIESLSDKQIDAIANGLAKADEWGLIDDLDEITASDSIDAIAAYYPELNLMKFNPDLFTEEYDRFDEGKFVTESLEDTVIHEAVHAKHAQAMEEDPDIDFEDLAQLFDWDYLEKRERVLIRELVSHYAGTNAFELVAEVGVKILKGEEVRDEAMYLYEKYHGPEL